MRQIDGTRFTGRVRALLGVRDDDPAGRVGYAVRLDWADPRSGTACHDLTQFTFSLPRALQRAAGTERFWARGPLRPLAVTVVPVDHRTFRSHAQWCGSTACPTTAPLLGMDAAGRAAATDRTAT